MHAPPQWQQDYEKLLASDDEVVQRVGRYLADTFRATTLRPPPRVHDQREAIIAAVYACFPLQFADGFQRWVEATARFQTVLEAMMHDEQIPHQERVSDAFGSFFDALKELWRRLTSFLPFIFMMTINRLGPDVMRDHGTAELEKALKHYERFYYTQSERQTESERRELLRVLLKLFRRLDLEGILDELFVLYPLVKRVGGFARLVPPRFEAHLLLIQQVRNRVEHDALAQRPPEFLAPLGRLLEAVFLDVVDILRPICEAYQLVYIAHIRRTENLPVADAIAFSGLGPPTPLALRLSGHGADADRVAEGELYLVRRGAEQDPAISPADYLNLTPFLIYERLQQTQTPAPAPQDTEGRVIFVFREFRKHELAAVFNEFAGTAALTVSARIQQAHLRHLIDAIEMFKQDLDRVVPIAPPSDTAGDWDHVFKRTWDSSRDHLACVMDPDRYEPTGKLSPDASVQAQRRTFVEELFVPPAEDSVADEFFASPHRGLVLTGPSGAGKSNLLSHWFLRTRREGRPAIFLTGRLITTPSFEEELLNHIVRQVQREWGFRELDEVLARHGASLLVVVDAVNEFTGDKGAQALLQDIIAFIAHEDLFRHVQVVLGCREETWNEYLQNRTQDRPLDAKYFYKQDAVRLVAVEDESIRAQLYATYQRHFGLQPESFAELSLAAKSLIRLPLMMAILAETYGASAAGGAPAQGGTVIPRDVDYFKLFDELTKRKLQDAQFLVPRGDARVEFPALVQGSLLAFAQLVYRRLTTPSPAVAHRPSLLSQAQHLAAGDALPWQEVQTKLEPFCTPPAEGGVAPLDAALQVGLLERSFVIESAYRGVPRTGRVWCFFHDEYAQYWLSAVYDAEVLQPAECTRGASQAQLERLMRAIRALLERSARAPLLEGALDHWLHAGLKLPPTTGEDLLLPLLDRLAVDESGAVRYFVQAFLARLLRRGVAAPKDLFGVVFREGGRDLTIAAAEVFLENWRDLTSPTLQAFFQTLRPPHEGEVLARLGDVFARHFIDAPDETAAYLDSVLKPVARLRDLAGAVLDVAARQRELQFVLEFGQRTLPAIWDRAKHGRALRALLWRKYQLVLSTLMKSREGKKGNRVARAVLHPLLERAGIRAWEQFGAAMPMSGNRQFFEDDRGVVQRNLVRELVPYVVALHNGALTAESLAPGQPLRALILRMLNHRVTSVVGFLAALVVPIVLRERPAEVEGLLKELIQNTTDSGRFFANLVLAHLAYLDPHESAGILAILHRRIVPWFVEWRPEDPLNSPLNWEWPTLFTLCITAGDPNALWPYCRKILTEIFADLDRRGDQAAASCLGEHLLKAAFLGDGDLGQRVLGMLIEDGCLEEPLWREAVLKVAAGLLARSPVLLRATLEDTGADGTIEREARGYLDKGVLYHRDTFSSQVSWDRAMVNMLAYDPRFRYLLIHDLIGGLARAQGTADIGVALRRAIVNTAVVIFGNEPDERYSQLSVDEVLGT